MVDVKNAADLWGKHRITSRIIAFVVLAVWAYMGIFEISGFADASMILGAIFLATMIGINMPDKITEAIKAWRGN
jgi:hypothetical protein